MLIAYLDEVGAPGAFVSTHHRRFSDSPAFGYAGFIIPEDAAREFGARFAQQKRTLFSNEIPASKDPSRWEKKGANLLYAKVNEERPQNLRVLGGLVRQLRRMNGHLFYYVDEKPLGTPKETNCGPSEYEARERHCMTETLNRLARHAENQNQNITVLMDQINENIREQRISEMYAHIYSRASTNNEMRRILEPPMHLDSKTSSNIQFADWACALVKRSVESQLVAESRYAWITSHRSLGAARGLFTFDSKLHLWNRSIPDLHHSEIFDSKRPVITPTMGLNPLNRESSNALGGPLVGILKVPSTSS